MSQDVATAAPIGVIPEWTLGDRLRKLRRMLGASQAAFAEILGTNQKTYASWEIDNSAPRHAQMIDVARRAESATGVPAGWLLGLVTSQDGRPITLP